MDSRGSWFRDTTTNRAASFEQRWKINAQTYSAAEKCRLVCVCVLLTVSLFMKPQIAAATSQAKRITKKKKN